MARIKKTVPGNKNNELLSGDNVIDVLHKTTEEDWAEVIMEVIGAYTRKTEIPILSEFCAEIGLSEELLIWLDDKRVNAMIKILENKKRAALERRIYSGELNATIGANLLKTWREDKTVREEKL